MAFYFSASVNDGQRMTVDELRARLTDLGVADPEHTAWDVEMAPGKRWGAILAENTAAIEAALTAAATAADERRKAKATKSTADKPAKAAPAKAAPAKAAAKPKAAPKAAATNGKKDVTPIPKAAPKKARGKAAAPVEPVVEVPVPEQSSSLAAQASAERKAVAVWQRGGEKGDRPATPAIDAMAERAAAKAS
jgi:hypothetical protein